MTFDEACAYLLALPRYAKYGDAAYRPGLARIEALTAAMGHPHEAFASVHVAGTNGKGSTASMLAAVASATGRRTGLHTSPHLFRLTERMRIDGAPAPDAWLAGAVTRFRAAMDRIEPSFFEAVTALSFLYFAEAGVDLAVVEVGLGGRLDATNVLRPRLCLITHIGHDHGALLGETLPEIAREKAGIVKPGIPVLAGTDRPEARAVIRTTAEERGAPFHDVTEEVHLWDVRPAPGHTAFRARTPAGTYEDLRVGLPGAHQARNAAVALRAAELLFDARPDAAEAVRAGLGDVRKRSGLRGRLEVLRTKPMIVADVAHNADGLDAALAFLRAVRPPGGRLYVLFGVMRDKDLDRMAPRLAAAGATVFPARLDAERARPVAELAAGLRAHGVAVAEAGSVAEGLARFRARARPNDALLVTGSHLTVAALTADARLRSALE